MITEQERIAIMGCGVVSAIGIGRESFWKGLVEGRSGVAPITSFDATGLRCNRAAEVRDFDPHHYLEGKPLRGMSRSAHLACSASALAFTDAGDAADREPRRTGIVAGTAFGNVNSMVRFDRETYEEGPRFVDAMLFPNTVINSPAGFVSIFLKVAGPNTTLTDGVASGLAALDYATGLLQRGVADVVLAGGFEELSQWVHLGLHNEGLLAGSRDGDAEHGVPFDRGRTGFVLGEGASFLVLANRAVPEKSGRSPLAWIVGHGEALVPEVLGGDRVFEPRVAREAMARSMGCALEAARLGPRDIDAVWASASGSRVLDRIEATALGDVFGPAVGELPVTAGKAAFGECYGASGALQVAGALLTLQEGIVPPTLGFATTDCEPELRGVRPSPQKLQEPRHVLVNAFNGLGNNRSLVLSRP